MKRKDIACLLLYRAILRDRYSLFVAVLKIIPASIICEDEFIDSDDDEDIDRDDEVAEFVDNPIYKACEEGWIAPSIILDVALQNGRFNFVAGAYGEKEMEEVWCDTVHRHWKEGTPLTRPLLAMMIICLKNKQVCNSHRGLHIPDKLDIGSTNYCVKHSPWTR